VAILRDESAGGSVLQRLFQITRDILQAQEITPALESIARGLSELYGWRYVSIVACDLPGGELYRRVLIGFPPETSAERRGEHIPRSALAQLLRPEFEAVPNCFFIPAEREQVWQYNIFTGPESASRRRNSPTAWHEHDSLTLVLANRNGEMLGYISVDGPRDGRVPTHDTLQEMQLFVNLAGLALGNARGQAVLEEASRAQSEFFTLVAHEVRSPLAAIRGATSLLDTHFDSLDKERRDEVLGVLSSSTARLSTIFEDFLLLSRMDARKLTLRMEAVDPVLVVEESVARIESQHPERRFQTFYLAPVAPVYADEGRVVQLLTNMLSNAAKYAAADSIVTVELKTEDERVVFAVKNEGPGIAEQDRDKIFTRFGRGSQNGDASIGLGLHICAQLAAMMGGSIGFESEPDKITTFWFALPRFSVVELHSEDPPRYP
jgi:signal transduction histidine kinase